MVKCKQKREVKIACPPKHQITTFLLATPAFFGSKQREDAGGCISTM
jgi:hypothetical protein